MPHIFELSSTPLVCTVGLAILIFVSYLRYAANINADKKIILIFLGCFSILAVQALE